MSISGDTGVRDFAHQDHYSYLRTRPAVQAIQFTVDQSVLAEAATQKAAAAKGPAPTRTSPPAPTYTNGTSATNGLKAPNGVSSAPSPSVVSPAPSSPAPSDIAPAAPSPIAGPSSALSKTEEAAAKDPEFAAALARQQEREMEQAKLLCSLENKEACLMCSG